MEGVDESIPYPHSYKADYPSSKAIAERIVIDAANIGLATVALRPHLIWGPGDTQLIPKIISRARSGALRKIGQSNKLVAFTYVDNAAQAHLNAACLLSVKSTISGKAYFISDNNPIPFWDFVNRVLEIANLSPVTRSIPSGLAYSIGWLCENFYRRFSLWEDPPLTRFLVEELATAHWFNISAACRDFHYMPKVDMETGLSQLKYWLHSSKNTI